MSDLSEEWQVYETCLCVYIYYVNKRTNPFLLNVPILYPLKTPENQTFSGIFRGYEIEKLGKNGLN